MPLIAARALTTRGTGAALAEARWQQLRGVGQVSVAASEAVTLLVTDKSCDARGATLHYTISGVWHALSDGGCHGDAVARGPFMGAGSRIDVYVCNTNTRTGYKNCSSKRPSTSDQRDTWSRNPLPGCRTAEGANERTSAMHVRS
jgi:hypothetical protein